MEIFGTIAGILILLLVTVDIFWTTLWVDGGAGPVSRWLGNFSWKVLRKVSHDDRLMLSLGGPLILALTLVIWILLLWTGWLLFFTGDAQAFIDTRDNDPISWTERVYYTGYLIFTLGVGDYVPKEGFWQVASAVASGNGMLFITLGVTYVLSVLSAVTNQRAYASSITGLGDSGSEIIRNAWNGENFHDLDLLLSSTASELSTLTAQHNAYPILHFYHSRNPKQSASFAVAVLDEALTILRFGILRSYQPNKLLVQEARSSIQNYLDTLTPNFVTASKQVPPCADLSELSDSGLPTTSADQFSEHVKRLEDRRKKLLGIIESDARQWPTPPNRSGSASD
ncbi:ion channel [Planococcus lenghuensis]|uniref:Potassium channel domain-containing protein n=1 Tax=Planococcus lenghuensis TaxID=2213202 RepID=A0A1Q2KZG3_9BACL|nr:ion channel [Planococcus lenghuensis]AQQ53590.1 hypothetical protein B0X71_11235 [Planococcus lenghuensis]